MKIAVIGPGAMGMLYGGKLSAAADAVLVGNNAARISEIREYGVAIHREGTELVYHPDAVLNGEEKEPADLVILFTKAYLTEGALTDNRALIGADTFVLSLQNGMGHERILRKFADENHVLIGTTAQGSSRINGHTISHTGLGETVIGALRESDNRAQIEEIRQVFEKAGFPCSISDTIRYAVWNKLMINASSSVLSGVLQKRQGYVAENEYAWGICCDLIREICDTACRDGWLFDYEEQKERIYRHLKQAPDGWPSICEDLKTGRRTEADFISGAVIRTAQEQGRQVPVQEMIVRLVHAMESFR
ncbi:MAG: ketopantoate reductase family protein [Solobacterium sp.]|nr:ketopantoate reductase family protein [Solobacterium sp.]